MNFVIVNVLVTVAFLQGITGQLGLASLLQLYAGDTDDANCTGVTGNICGKKAEHCNSTFLCIPTMPQPLQIECEEGKFCNEGVCSSVKSPFCEYGDKKFICSNQGIYPEPSSCKKFNYCVPILPKPLATEVVLEVFPSDCDDGWGFNPATGFCDKKLINNKCTDADRPVATCTKTGDNGALKGNPSMYYICAPYPTGDKGLYPNIYKCPGNTKYVGNYVCK